MTGLLHPIHSEELVRHLNSFELEYSASRKSFVRSLLPEQSIHQLVYYINSLSTGIELTKTLDDDNPRKVIVLEVDVISENDQLSVKTKEDASKTGSFFLKGKRRVRVILVHSESLNVIDAKLAVYRKYAHSIDLQNTYLHHSLEDCDEFARFCASWKLSPYYDQVKLLEKTFSINAHRQVVENAFASCVTRNIVREICCGEYIDGKALGSGPYKCRLQTTVKSLKKELVDNTLRNISESLGSEICRGIYRNISEAVEETLESEFSDLRRRLSIDVIPFLRLDFREILIEIFRGISDIIVAITEFFVTIIFPVDINTLEWRRQVADDIFEQVSKNCPVVIDKMVKNISEIFSPTVQDLEYIKYKIKSIMKELDLPVNQAQIVELWKKRDVLRDKARLKRHRAFLQYIAGLDSDGKPTIKVFYRDDNEDEEFESFCKGCFSVSDDTKFEFVPVAVKAPRKIKQDDKIAVEEKKAPAINTLKRRQLEKIIDEQEDTIYARYSNVIGIGISRVRCEGNNILNEPCIVLYCLVKGITPFGENKLPVSLEGNPCDVREDFVMFGKRTCPHYCPASNKNFPEPGCCIGITDSYGSVGFLVEFKNHLTCGFLTASHVVVQGFRDFYRHNIRLPNTSSSRNKEPVVHIINSGLEHTNVGEVAETFFGNYDSKEGVDLALVKSEMLRQGDKEILSVVKYNDITFGEFPEVRKTGKATGPTKGILTENIRSVKVEGLIFKNCYAVRDTEEEKFFESGDSGSGVFLKRENTMQPLGIAFAFMDKHTLVCRIDKILDHLDLAIVQYRSNV